MAKKIKYKKNNGSWVIISQEKDYRSILRDKNSSHKTKKIVIKPLENIDVVHVYSPSALNALIDIQNRHEYKKVYLTREREIRKRRFKNLVLGITRADLIGIAQQE